MTKKVKTKKKINKLNLWAIIVSCVAVLALIGLIAGIGVIAFLLKDRPEINLSDFDQAESSVIYDSEGNEIANLGTVIRQNVEYEEIPNCVIDAFVAIEDSRYFEHNGFDVPRFTKAFLENIRTMSFGQGGSTFTMQLVKNTYFVNDETGQNAARSGASGIKRKVQEISLAMELEKVKSKQDIFESYVNKLNFGGSNNIRGIQKASQYYFGKDISECGLVEGALLAGVINAPNYYNPFYNLEEAQERTLEVLYQMRNHGYITKAEYELAKSIRVEDLLKDPYAQEKDGEGIPYQAYVDVVVSEVINLTGLDPYTTTMHIYTYMNRKIQEQMDDIQAGNMGDYLEFPDDYFECASVCIKNSTGEVVGILGGRNYSNGGQLLLNHATEQYKQPGSSIKPILDYALAFENLGWATDHVLTDKPMYYDDVSKIPVVNDSGTYVGDVTLKQALGQSINTCAIQALSQVLAAKKYEYVVNYAQSLGYDFNLEDFDIQYAIGGNTCEVSPYQHAAAYAAIMNYGVYNTPHTIERIEFTNGKSPITPTYQSSQVISEQAAFLTTELMYSNAQNYGGSYSFVKDDKYAVYAKTGTTDYGTSGTQFGIPSGATKDGWLVAATSEYTTATWVGYEKAVTGQPSYITNDYYYNQRPQGKIAHLILEAAYEYGGSTPTKITQPSGVTSITHIIGTWPYASFKEGMDESLRTTGLIKSDSVKLVALAEPKVENISSINSDNVIISNTGSNVGIKLIWPEYPDKTMLEEASDTKDISLRDSSGNVIIAATGKSLFSYSKLYGTIKYMADITVDSYTEHVVSNENSAGVTINASPGDSISVSMYYGFENTEYVSNKETYETKTTLTITMPSQNASRDTVKTWADQYSFVYYDEDYSSTPNTYSINTAGYEYDKRYNMESATRIDVVYHLEKSITLTPTSGGTSISIGASVSDGSTVTWSNDSNSANYGITTNGNNYTISLKNESTDINDSFTVTATSGSVVESITINVVEGKFSAD